MRTPWLFLSIVFATAQSQVTFVGHQVLRIHANSEEQLALVKSLERMEHLKLDFWKEPVRTALPIDVRVPRKHVHTVKSFLESNGITYSVMIKNLQSLVDEEHVSMLISELRNGTYSFNYRAYHRLKEIYTWVKNLAAENPRLVRRQRIGRSSQGRPLHILKFSTGRKRPAIWIDSAIHGREWISPAVAIWIAKKITTDYGNDPSITSLLNKMDIFMLIMANPDGYVYSRTKNRMWRKTMSKKPGSHCIGVDANRNFDANFGGNGSSKAPCAESYCGPHVHSEPEVKAIVNFIQKHGNFMVFITLHSYLQRLLYPYGYTHVPPENAEELATLASEAIEVLASLYGTRYTYGSIIQTINESSGNSIDWSYNQGIKYPYAFELRDEGQYGFVLPPSQIIPTAEETWLAIKKIMEHASNRLP
ncbi:carboxypeptidase A1-like isoform X1 [Carcharodon carcharias]|uniref:carboxypeptidase A1-like isoform X1 n=2 Tax=Carcharodon carcharias TaxID=13397 RepID=UPI001B7F7438|nr:carboxypeptidase A1-like isoform X1 [Carcharodon carcharias]XP_041058946.1 carboxypeptidase A1-like isoform X1 [Carcharodon carcharias]XP_041058947.1 carboxypeptidase A1-like isoform X1 [Carcharodon carcharias]